MLAGACFKGSIPPSFFSSTNDSRAVCNASARCAAVSLSPALSFDQGTIAGGSNIPNRNRAVMSRVIARSTSASLNKPCATASNAAFRSSATRACTGSPQIKSIPALIAAATPSACVVLYL